MERKCSNCLLFNSQESVCTVVVLLEGERYELPVLPNDNCHWERLDSEINQSIKYRINDPKQSYFKDRLERELNHSIEIKEIKSWSDGKNGFIKI